MVIISMVEQFETYLLGGRIEHRGNLLNHFHINHGSTGPRCLNNVYVKTVPSFTKDITTHFSTLQDGRPRNKDRSGKVTITSPTWN